MKYDKLFDSSMETSRLSLLYFKLSENADTEEKKKIKEAFYRAYRVADSREMLEAMNGVYR